MKTNAAGRAAGMLAAVLALAPGIARAHCDSVGGPLIPEALEALAKGDLKPVLKWVKIADEPQVRAAFARAVAVRGKGPEAKELADQYFLETLVRLHRAGEGAPFTGIRAGLVDPVAVMTDKALAEGKADEMIARLQDHLAKAVNEKFRRAREARRHKDAGVEAGRRYVDAYVIYTHYVEALHAAIVSAGGHAAHAD